MGFLRLQLILVVINYKTIDNHLPTDFRESAYGEYNIGKI